MIWNCDLTPDRLEEEIAARAKLDKEKRDLLVQLQELQDDLDAEREAKGKVEKQRKQLAEVCGCFLCGTCMGESYVRLVCMFVYVICWLRRFAIL